MSGVCALGIDVGTSGVRAAILSPGGSVEAVASRKMADHGEDLREPAVWKRTLESTLHDLAALIDLSSIGSISVDGTSGTVLALDMDGQPIGTGLMYNDAVDDPKIPTMISAVAPRESAAHGAASALARAIALQSRPGTARILHQADWIAELIAGKPVPSDESNALKTGYDPIQRTWPDWLGDTPLKLDLLPDVLPAGSQTGYACGEFGLPSDAITVAGVTDGCASFLATGASSPGDAVSALGTTLTVKLLSPRPIFAPELGIYSHRIGEMWLAGGASNTGGGVLACFFSPEDIDELCQQIDPSRSTGLDYYPLTKPGERFPINDPQLQPRLEPRPSSDHEFLKGLLEGMARIEAEGYSRLGELGAGDVTSIRTVGGGASNAVWRKMRLDRLGVPEAPVLSEEAAVGVAQLALGALSKR